MSHSGNLAPERGSKYRRPRRLFALPLVLLGLILGVGGGLYWAWERDPRVELNTEPWQLDRTGRANYIAAITLDYAYDSDLNRAVQRLLDLKSSTDPIQQVADVACEMASSAYVETTAGIRAVQSMMVFYQLQGRKGCADNLIPMTTPGNTVVTIEVATPTPPPPATKTAVPVVQSQITPTSPQVFIPTAKPQTSYTVATIRTDCDVEFSGVIEVRVQDFNGDGVPGQEIRVRWDDGESTFFTGLKPERGPDYADFQMEAGKSYTVEMPGQSDPTQPLAATTCTAGNGQPALTLYRVYFRPG